MAVVMVGAAFTHLAHGEIAQTLIPVVFLGLLFLAGWVRRPGWLRRGSGGLDLANGSRSPN